MLRRNCLLVVVLVGAALALTAVESPGDPEAEQHVEEGPKGCDGRGGQDGDAAELSVESGLNATGHWLAKVRLQHALTTTTSENGQQPPVQLQLKRWARRTARGDGAHLVTLQATLTGPLSSSEEDLPWDDSNKSYTESRKSRPLSCPVTTTCPTCPDILTSGPTESSSSSCPPPPTCPTCLLAPPKPCPTSPPCPIPSPCPSCPTVAPPPPPQKCPSPCPSACPTPPPCPACPSTLPTPIPFKCPSPCPAPSACPACPSCPSCPTPRPCPSPCALPPRCPACPSIRKPTPYGYKSVSGSNSTYRLHLIPRDWFTALATCEREGGYLAIINTEEEARAIKTFLNNPAYKFVEYIFIGIHDLHREGSWYTVLDEPFHTIHYHKWERGEPNNDGNQDCGGIYSKDITLDDNSCNSNQVFLCELELY